MKDYEHRLLQCRDRNLSGQVHHLERPAEPFNEDQDPHDFNLADQVVDACLVELNLLETPSETLEPPTMSLGTPQLFHLFAQLVGHMLDQQEVRVTMLLVSGMSTFSSHQEK